MGNFEKMMNFGSKGQKKGLVFDIFMNFRDGDNPVRLVGNIEEVRYHYVGMPKDKLLQSIAEPNYLDRNNPDNIPAMVACLDWDVENQVEKEDKKCPYCAIQREMFRRVRKEALSEEQVKVYKTLSQQMRVQSSNKVNCIDRRDPYVTKKDGDVETKVKGYKIASFGSRAMESLASIFKATKRDLASIEDGIDLIVNKSNKSGNTSYSIVPVISGTSMKISPLTEEERSWQMHNVKIFGGTYVPVDKMIRALRPEFSIVYQDIVRNSFSARGGNEPAPVSYERPAPVSAPASAPVSSPAPIATSAPANVPANVPVSAPVVPAPAKAPSNLPKCIGFYEEKSEECEVKCPEHIREQCKVQAAENG